MKAAFFLFFVLLALNCDARDLVCGDYSGVYEFNEECLESDSSGGAHEFILPTERSVIGLSLGQKIQIRQPSCSELQLSYIYHSQRITTYTNGVNNTKVSISTDSVWIQHRSGSVGSYYLYSMIVEPHQEGLIFQVASKRWSIFELNGYEVNNTCFLKKISI